MNTAVTWGRPDRARDRVSASFVGGSWCQAAWDRCQKPSHGIVRCGTTLEHGRPRVLRLRSTSCRSLSSADRPPSRTRSPRHPNRWTNRSAHGVAEPTPRLLLPEGSTRREHLRDPLAGGPGGPLHGRFAQADPGRFREQLGPLLEAVGHGSAQGREAFHGRGQAACGQSDAVVPGPGALATSPAVVIGSVACARSAERLDRFFAVPVEGCGAFARGTVDGSGGVPTLGGGARHRHR